MAETLDNPNVVALSDAALALAIDAKARSHVELLITANGFTARAAVRATDGGWSEIGRGDFGLRSAAAAKQLVEAGKLRWWEVSSSPVECDLSTEASIDATSTFIDHWLQEADKLTGSSGRGDAPKKEDELYLGYQCGWRCQFAGCGKDLKRESLSGTGGNFSYFAHIIASSPKGPRGDKLLSGERADDINNIMLMCDECHRRIDRVDPDRFTVDILRQMRQDSINEVKRLLDTLRYEDVLPIVLMGNITAQSPRFNQRDAEEAMWTRRVRMAASGPERYFYNGGHLHNPHAAHYWGALFESLKDDIPLLRKRLNGTLRPDGNAMPLAVFPLHCTSMLVLAGRLIGESSRIVLFQFDRDRSPHLPGAQWAFNEGTSAPAESKYCLRELSPQVDSEEACLFVSLTFKVEPSRIPATLYESNKFAVGALEVTATDPASLSPNIIGHPSDLDLLSQVLQAAVQRLQDNWKAKKVHLFIGAPASASFKLGQKLQARNHAAVVVYESLPGSGTQYLPTIAIYNDRVEEVQTGTGIALL
jgi:hypothetical protein